MCFLSYKKGLFTFKEYWKMSSKTKEEVLVAVQVRLGTLDETATPWTQWLEAMELLLGEQNPLIPNALARDGLGLDGAHVQRALLRNNLFRDFDLIWIRAHFSSNYYVRFTKYFFS